MAYVYPPTVNGENRDFVPFYEPYSEGTSPITVDPEGQLRTRSLVLTDEGGYCANYSGDDLFISAGICTFTSGSDTVAWTPASSYKVKRGEYIKLSSDPDTKYRQIDALSTTTLYLASPYTGTSSSGVGFVSVEQPKLGNGMSTQVISGACFVSAGVSASSVAELERDVDVYPMVVERQMSISQRIANQDIYMGVYDEDGMYWAWFQFTGTDASKVITSVAHCRSGTPTGTDIEQYTVSIPQSMSTGSILKYKIELEQTETRFMINDIVVARHENVVLNSTDILTSTLRIVNGATPPASNTVVAVYYSRVNNFNKVSVGFSDRDANLFDSNIPKENCNAIPTRIAPQNTWRTSFAKTISANGVDTQFFNLLQTGSGQAVSQSGSNLNFFGGTSANSESVVRSVNQWSDSWMLRYGLVASSRIINTNLIIELVDVIGDNLACSITNTTTIVVTIPNNPFTSLNIGQGITVGMIVGAAGIPMRGVIASVSGNAVTLTVAGWPASGSCTVSLFGWNYHQLIYTGATATNCTYDAQRFGWNSGTTTATINTTASPGHFGQLYNDDGYATFGDGLLASNVGYQVTQRASRMQNIPSTDTQLYLQIRCLNGTTNPASSIVWNLQFVSMEEFAPVPVVLQGTKQTGLGAGVQVANTVTVTATNLQSNMAQVGGTNTVAGGLAGTLAVGGMIAHDSAMTLTYKPVAVGGVVKTTQFATTLVDNDAVFAAYAANGAATNKPFSVPDLDWVYAATAATTTSANITLKAATASYRSFVTGLQYQNTNSTPTEIIVKDSSAVVMWRGYAPASMTAPANIMYQTPLKTSVVSADILANCVTSGASVYFNAQGYTAL